MDWLNYLITSETAGTNTGDPNYRKMVMSSVVQPPSGRRQILFRRVIGSTVRIVRMEDISALKDGSSWRNPVVVENVSTDFVNPCLLIDSSGNLHALYRKKVGSYFKLRYAKSTDGGATWGTYADIPFPSATQNVEWTSACIGQDNTIYAFGSQLIAPNGYRIYCYAREPVWGIWSAGITGSGAMLPRNYPSATQIVALPSAESFVYNGVQHLEIVFAEKNASGVYRLANVYTLYDPENFVYSWVFYPGPIDSELVSAAAYNSMAVSVARRRVYSVYSKPDATGKEQIFFKKKTLLSNDWSAAVKVNIAQALIGTQYPSITIGVDGRLYVAWNQKNGGVTKGSGVYVET